MKDRLFFVRSALAAFTRAESLRIKLLHLSMVGAELAAEEEDLASLKLMFKAAQLEAVRLADAEKVQP